MTTNSDGSTITRDTTGATIETCEPPLSDSSVYCYDTATLNFQLTYPDGSYYLYDQAENLIISCDAPALDGSLTCTDGPTSAVTVTQSDNSSVTTNVDGSTITKDTSDTVI